MEQEPTDRVELMHRHNHGADVFLMWHQEMDILSIILRDESQHIDTEFVVPNDKGMEAFTHPYVWRPKEDGKS